MKYNFLILLTILFLSINTFALTDTNLVSWWNLDETSGVIFDDAKGDNNATLDINSTPNSPGILGNAIRMYRSPLTDLNISNEANFDFITAKTPTFTVSMWYKGDTSTSMDVLWSKWIANNGVKVDVRTDGKIYLSHYYSTASGESWYSYTGNTTILDGSWHNLVITAAGSEDFLVYVDGSLKSTTKVGSGPASTPNNSYPFMFGNSGLNIPLSGYIDELSVWNKDLNQTFVDEIYNSGTGVTYCSSNSSFQASCSQVLFVDYNYVLDYPNSKVILTDTSTIGNATITDWNWTNWGLEIATTKDYNYTIAELTDYNICLFVDTNVPDLNGTKCYTFSTPDLTAPVTTFSSFQVPNTTDQNITLTCNDTNGYGNILGQNTSSDTTYDLTYGTCTSSIMQKFTAIYPTNNYLKLKKGTASPTSDQNFTIQVCTLNSQTCGPITTCTCASSLASYTMSGEEWASYNADSNVIIPMSFSTTQGTKYGIFIDATSGTTGISSIGYSATTGFNGEYFVKYIGGFPGCMLDKYTNKSLFFEIGKQNSVGCDYFSYRINNGAWTTKKYTDANRNFLYSGTGINTIDYNSTDYNGNQETTKTSLFTTYGKLTFNTYDENTGLDLNGTQINFNGSDYVSGTNLYDFNLQGITAQQYTFTITKTGYGTRYYQVDLNQLMDINVSFLLLPTSMGIDTEFTFYDPTNVILPNTYIEVMDWNKNLKTISRLKTSSSGEATFNLNQNYGYYRFYINNGQYDYNAVSTTIYRPKNSVTLADIPDNWNISVSGIASINDANLSGVSRILLLYSNTTNAYVVKVSSNAIIPGSSPASPAYLSASYFLQFTGNPLTYTLQPYLVPLTSSALVTTINVLNKNTLAPLPGITVKFYETLPGLGKTLMGQGLTDSKGQIFQVLTLGNNYTFDVYNKTVFLKSFNYTALTNETFIYFNFLILSDTNALPPISVDTNTDMNVAVNDFYAMRNILFNTCTAKNDCFPSALIAILLTLIVLVVATAIDPNHFIGVKGLSVIGFICLTVFFGVGWLPIYIYAFLGSISLLLAVMVQ